MAKAIMVVGSTKREAEQRAAQADLPKPYIAAGKNLPSLEGVRVAQVLILNTVKDLPVEHTNQLRRQLAISTCGARALDTAIRE